MGESTMAIGGNWSSMAKSHHQKEKPPPPGAPEAHNSLPAPPQTQNGAFKKVTTLPWRRRRPNQSCGLSPGCRGRGGGGGEPQRRLQEGDDEVAAAWNPRSVPREETRPKTSPPPSSASARGCRRLPPAAARGEAEEGGWRRTGSGSPPSRPCGATRGRRGEQIL
uniref:Uncharacterized protein n=1 Tax=Aegilops tauschii subsp. strangulata TaxID=200361 RepID=A0A453P8F6_AEGTS